MLCRRGAESVSCCDDGGQRRCAREGMMEDGECARRQLSVSPILYSMGSICLPSIHLAGREDSSQCPNPASRQPQPAKRHPLHAQPHPPDPIHTNLPPLPTRPLPSSTAKAESYHFAIVPAGSQSHRPIRARAPRAQQAVGPHTMCISIIPQSGRYSCSLRVQKVLIFPVGPPLLAVGCSRATHPTYSLPWQPSQEYFHSMRWGGVAHVKI
jgi:hypothetical protein